MSEILIVDDEMGIRELLSEILSDEGFRVQVAENAGEARKARSAGRPDLVLLDIWMPDTDGVTLLKEWAAGGQLTMPVVMMSGHATIETAVEATRFGAFDFLEKPIALQKLLDTVNRALTQRPAADAPTRAEGLGSGAAVADLSHRLSLAARVAAPVLLAGEPGAGQERAARAFLARGGPWVSPEHPAQLAEAPMDLLAAARDGVLWIPEIAFLTRQEQKGLVLAASRLDRYRVRLLAGTTRPLAELAGGAVEPLLYQAFAQLVIQLPPLRAHPEDIPELADAHLARLSGGGGVPRRRLSAAAAALLAGYAWPGNLAQLESVVAAAALAARGEEIGADQVAEALRPHQPAAPAGAAADGLSLDLPLREARDEFERLYLEHHLRAEGGNMSRVAEKIGLERTHLYRKLKQLGIRAGKREDE